MDYNTGVPKGENPMTKLDMLMAREELLKQVEFIIDDELPNVHPSQRYNVILGVCDAICEQFPAALQVN
jgi:hypothetical protein